MNKYNAFWIIDGKIEDVEFGRHIEHLEKTNRSGMEKSEGTDNYYQCNIVNDYWIYIHVGKLTNNGLRFLQTELPKFKNLESITISDETGDYLYKGGFEDFLFTKHISELNNRIIKEVE